MVVENTENQLGNMTYIILHTSLAVTSPISKSYTGNISYQDLCVSTEDSEVFGHDKHFWGYLFT